MRAYRTWITVLVVMAIVGAALIPLGGGAPSAEASHSGVRIVLGAEGPDQPLRNADLGSFNLGAEVTWVNDAGQTLSVTSDDGTLDSGPIPHGGKFVASLPAVGPWVWTSDVGDGIVNVIGGFDGGLSDPVNAAIPAVPFPPRQPDDIGLHPDLARLASFTRAIVGFEPETTIRDARDALNRADLDLVGGLPLSGLVLVQLDASEDDFGRLTGSLETLRTQPGVEFAALDLIEVDSTVPAPSRDGTNDSLQIFWDGPDLEPDGTGGNWGLELLNAPAAWNVNETVERRGNTPATSLVVDSGFEVHEDLDRLEIRQLCSPAYLAGGVLDIQLDTNCTSLAPDDHGNHVAGIVGADHDDRLASGESVGVTGMDPHSRLVAISRLLDDGTPIEVDGVQIDGTPFVVYERILEEILSGDLGRVGAINHSTAFSVDADAWASRWADQTCGPGADDDDTGTEPCLPDNEDSSVQETALYGLALRRVLEAYVTKLADPPLFLAAAGNNSNDHCVPLASSCAESEKAPLQTSALSSMASARDQWKRASFGEPPILIVEGLATPPDTVDVNGPGRGRASLSNIGGDISAPAFAISTQTTAPGNGNCGTAPDSYCLQIGTSQATPYVTGIAGVLRAWDPSLTTAELRDHLLTWRVHDTFNGAVARADAFLPLSALDGALGAVADVNDPSPDGNRRVIYGDDGLVAALDEVRSSEPGFTTEPDLLVDMRDFRPFRDAWLQTCRSVGDAGCPAFEDIHLDGGDDHVKRDLNRDGCVNLAAPGPQQRCPSETVWNRYDLNGDGRVSSEATAVVGVRPDGSPAADPGEATGMTDLEVLQSQWSGIGPEGVAADDLDDLLVSGDLEVHLDGLDRLGATDVILRVADGTTGAPLAARAVPLDGHETIVTVPALRPVVLELLASSPFGDIRVETPPQTLLAGQDRRLDACGGLTLEAEPNSLRPGGESAVISAGVTVCGGSAEGVEVDFAVLPTVAGGPTLSSSSAVTDADGRASVTVTSGDVLDDFVVTATADVPLDPDVGTTATRNARTPIRVGEPYALTVVAADGAASGYDLLAARDFALRGPSINQHGSVAFSGFLPGADAETLFVGDEHADPYDPATVVDLATGAVDPGATIDTGYQLNDAGTVIAQFGELEDTTLLDWILTFDLADPGTATEVAAGATQVVGGPITEFGSVRHPTVSGDGEVLFTADPAGGDGEVLVAPNGDGTYRTSPLTPAGRARLADDGVYAAGAVGTNADGLLADVVVLGDTADLDAPRLLVAQGGLDGWLDLGDPDISATGDIVAFTGDRGSGDGLWLSGRRGTGLDGWQEAQLIAGGGQHPDEIGPGRTLHTLEGRPGVIHRPQGASGLDGDRVWLVVEGIDSDGLAGIWSLPVDLAVEPDGSLTVAPGRVRAVLTEGDTICVTGNCAPGEAVNVVDLAIQDPLAEVAGAEDPESHRVAVAAEVDAGQVVILRADWQGTPLDASTTAADTGVEETEPLALSGATVPVGEVTLAAYSEPIGGVLLAADSGSEDGTDTDEAGTGDENDLGAIGTADHDDGFSVDTSVVHVPALTYSADPVTTDVPFTVANRTRTIHGDPAWAAAWDGPFGPRDEAELLAPDEVRELVVASVGNGHTARITLAAPVASAPDIVELTVHTTVEQGANRPPEADAGGPYTIPLGLDLTLHGSASDLDGGTHSFAWDLDGDGDFDDAALAGHRGDVTLTAAEVESLICGGDCTSGDAHTVALEVTDPEGANDVDTTTVTVDPQQTFTMRAGPDTLKIEPGERGTAIAVLDSVSGFSEPVEVDIPVLPDGWSAFGGNTSSPPSNVELRITVPESEVEDLFELEVVATSGSIERRDTFTVSTAFGLIPECSATFSGVVHDADTGEPVDGVRIRSGFQNEVRNEADGSFLIEQTLSEGYELEEITLVVDRVRNVFYPPEERYYSTQVPVLAECDGTYTVDIALEPFEFGGVAGRVVEGIASPFGGSLPTHTPLEAAAIRLTHDGYSGATVATTPLDGTFDLPDSIVIPESGRDSGAQPRFDITLDGYWPAQARPTVFADELVDLGDIGLVRKCTGVLGGGWVEDEDGGPVADATVLSPDGDEVVTDEDGRFDFDIPAELAHNNGRKSHTLRAIPPWSDSASASGRAWVEGCDLRSEDIVLRITRPADLIPNYGSGDGTVFDEETLEPLEDVLVRLRSAGDTIATTRTGADGTYRFDDIFLGFGLDTSSGFRVEAIEDGYWTHDVPVTFTKDTTVTTDLPLLRERFGTVVGEVTDVDTGEPIVNADIEARSPLNHFRSGGTGIGGVYELDEMMLAYRNEPRTWTISASKRDPATDEVLYWLESATTEVRSGETSVVDLQLLRRCYGGTVSGRVLDATTLEPLEDVIVATGGDVWDTTDADGNFVLEDVPVGDHNTFNQVTIRASKEGFFEASKPITVFCGAQITTNFGVPVGGLGTVIGTVTDAATGEPIEGVDIGSGWGSAVQTDADGAYRFEDAPLGPDGEPQDWLVTAVNNRVAKEATVTAQAGSEVRQDFAFGSSDNRPPVADDLALETTEGTPVGVALSATDPDGDAVTFTIVDGPTDGTLSGTPPSLTYTPDDGFLGEDRFTYTAADPQTTSEPATVTITVTEAPNAVPTLTAPDEVEVTAGEELTVDVVGHDADDDPLTLAATGLPSFAGFEDLGGGDGRLTLTPAADAPDSEVTVTITVDDGEATADGDILLRVVALPPPNDPPQAVIAPLEQIAEGEEFVLDGSGSSDPDGDPLTYLWELSDGRRFDGEVVTVPMSDDFVGVVTLTVADPMAEQDLVSADLVVVNVPPTLVLTTLRLGGASFDPADSTVRTVDLAAVDPPPLSGTAGDVLVVQGRILDPGSADTHELVIDWGDGEQDTVAAPDRNLDLEHVYAEVGRYTVTLDVCDDDGGCDGRRLSVDVVAAPVPEPVDEPVVVADPEDDTDVRGVSQGRDTRSAGEVLPRTGSDLGGLSVLASALLAVGVMILRTTGRRPTRSRRGSIDASGAPS